MTIDLDDMEDDPPDQEGITASELEAYERGWRRQEACRLLVAYAFGVVAGVALTIAGIAFWALSV